MKNKRIFVLGGSGLIVLLASVILFVLLKPDGCNVSVSLGFGFLIFSEMVLFGGLIGLEYISGTHIMVMSGCGVTVVGYSIISSLVSLIYMIMNTESVRFFGLIETFLIAVTAILMVVFITVSGSVKEKDTKLMHVFANTTSMIDSLELLRDNSKYGKQLQKLADDLRFTDISSVAEVDNDIQLMISKIEMELLNDEYSAIVSEYIVKTDLLIKKRKNQVRDKKLGGV